MPAPGIAAVSVEPKSQFLEALSPENRRKVLAAATPRRYDAKTVVTNHGHPADKLFLLTKGLSRFFFITEGIHAALEQATAAAGGRDVRIGGGVSTVRQYLRAGLIDELHLAMRPVLLGSGEHLLRDIDMRALGYECTKSVAGERATHVFLRKTA